MKSTKLRLLTLLLVITYGAKGQELSFGFGMSSYYGDLIEKSHAIFSQPSLAGTVGYSYYCSPQFSIRGDFSVLQVKASDSKNSRADLKARNLSFKSYIWDLNLMGQYDLFDISSGERKFTPYAFLGLGFFHFNPYTTDRNGNKVYLRDKGTEGQGISAYPDNKPYKTSQLCVPFGLGVKYALNDNWTVGFEFKYRYSGSDYIDDVSTNRYPDQALLAAKDPTLPMLTYRGDELPGGAPYPSKTNTLPRGNPDNADSYYSFQAKISWRIPSSRIQINY